MAKPLRQLYDYILPLDLATPDPGMRVSIPFGNQTIVGMCMAITPASNARLDPPRKLKSVLEILDKTPVLPADLLTLAKWSAAYYHHPIGEVIFAALPATAKQGKALTPSIDQNWRIVAGSEPAPASNATRLRAALQILGANDYLPESSLRAEGVAAQTLRKLESKGWIEKYSPSLRKHRSLKPAGDILTLTEEQEHVLQVINHKLDTYHCFLLNGVTGSGKTEIYLRTIAQVLQGKEQKPQQPVIQKPPQAFTQKPPQSVIQKPPQAFTQKPPQALVLVPEIALTPQTLARFRARFEDVDMIHSGLPNRARTDAWLRCRAGETRILIGTRSAIFTPFENLALIVVDEEHDGSFKQQEGFRYSARDLAVKRASDLNIPLILGSATPSLESLYNAKRNRYQELKLNLRTTGTLPPKIKILDIRGHKLNDGLSNKLQSVIRRHLDASNQVLLFVNRRGYAPSYLCTHCAWLASCKRCDARLTLHSQPAGLRCHHCDFRSAIPDVCPKCNRAGLIPVGTGTQRSEDGMKSLFPDVPIIRIDRDSTRNVRRLEEQLNQINKAGPAILIGTQMLAKGHHFPSVTLVAIVNIDAGFFSADFRAPEHTAQLIVQVAGRAGRADKAGEVWIQTYSPDNPLLRALIEKGYGGFCDSEINARENASLPPFSFIAMLRADANDQLTSQQWLSDWVGQVSPDKALEVLGPAPAPLGKKANRFRSQCLLIAKNRPHLHNYIENLLKHTPKSRAGNVRWSIDVDPYNTY
ncbi:MAG: primosomal protein N' [Pseudomonadales bacterium]|nr:primosomal protein N' [Pseudomonadales bacterium]